MDCPFGNKKNIEEECSLLLTQQQNQYLFILSKGLTEEKWKVEIKILKFYCDIQPHS